MRYCSRCVTPDTRPNIRLDDEGVCNACRNFERRKEIDWTARADSFAEVVERAKSRSVGYDCLIPVSGGKDSTWQVVKCLEYGLNPLCVTWKTPARTRIGHFNLRNLVSLGVDHIDYQINPKVEKKFMLKSFVRYGSTAIPMHMAIFSIPLKLASHYQIPLIVWGENSAFEYGNAKDEHTGFRLDREWLRHYGVTHGTTAEDWIDEDLGKKELFPYFAPSEDELETKGINAIFLGYYFEWDVRESLRIALLHGFRYRQAGSRTGYYNFADIDDDFISIHHYLKWYKFGINRLFDNLSLEIRHNRISRDDAIEIIRERGDEMPVSDIRKFCDFVGITRKKFFEIAEKFRNHQIWKRDGGRWVIDDFIVKGWNW